MIGASADGNYVYFSAQGQLVAGQPLLAPSGAHGVYLWHDGSIRYIGSFASTSNDWVLNMPIGAGGGRSWAGSDFPASRVSPDGKTLLFVAHDGSGLTEYDHNTTGCGGGSSSCTEFYVYTAANEKLACASCNPSGAKATTDATTYARVESGGANDNSHENHSLSDDGRYVFFSTGDRLVSGDRNGSCLTFNASPQEGGGSCYDAYEYDTQTEQVHLLSSGESDSGSFFLDASANGRDAFFATKQALSRWDVDTGYDIYDARVDGGLPEPPPPPACQGDACQPAPAQLNDPTPSSSSYAGPGNAAEGASCAGPARRAKRLAQRARRLRHQAKRAMRHGNRRAAHKLARAAKARAKRAHGLSRRAKRCRRPNRGAGK